MRINPNWKYFLSYNWLTRVINERCARQATKYVQGKLLDVGCGEKPYFGILNPYVEKYIGIEHPNTLHKDKHIDLYADACRIPFKKDSFNCVVSFQVMEHISEPGYMLTEVYRVLQKGGNVVLTTPFMWGIHERPNDFYRYTRYGLQYLLEKAGFEIINIEANTGFWVMAGLRFNYYLARLARGYLLYTLSPIFLIVQLTSLILDRIYKAESDTASYTVIARKN